MDLILVIDDNSTNLAICKALLSPTYRVATAKSGIQALGYLKNEALPDLILLDSTMPGMGGMEVLKKLMESEMTKDIPVIMKTENADIDYAAEGYGVGASDFIIAPVIPLLLLKKIELLLELKRLREENKRLKNDPNPPKRN